MSPHHLTEILYQVICENWMFSWSLVIEIYFKPGENDGIYNFL